MFLRHAQSCTRLGYEVARTKDHVSTVYAHYNIVATVSCCYVVWHHRPTALKARGSGDIQYSELFLLKKFLEMGEYV